MHGARPFLFLLIFFYFIYRRHAQDVTNFVSLPITTELYLLLDEEIKILWGHKCAMWSVKVHKAMNQRHAGESFSERGTLL